MKFPLQGKLVLITGASGGIGAALAVECGRRGARVALASRDFKRCKALAARIPGAKAYRLDVTQLAQVKNVARQLGHVDVLINNAGVHLIAKVEEVPEALFKKALDTNLLGPLRMIQALLPGMKRRHSGMIVQIGSTLAYRSLENVGAYSATKAALMRLTESLRMELAADGIHVLDVAPGVVATKLREHAYFKGPKPKSSASLPFARDVTSTARQIVDAMEAAKRDVMPAAWLVRLGVRYLSALAPGWMDRRLRGRN